MSYPTYVSWPTLLADAACRQSGCGHDALHHGGWCPDCGLQYLEWRVMRDQLEHDDLAALGYEPHEPLDAATADAIDALFRHLTPGPFNVT